MIKATEETVRREQAGPTEPGSTPHLKERCLPPACYPLEAKQSIEAYMCASVPFYVRKEKVSGTKKEWKMDSLVGVDIQITWRRNLSPILSLTLGFNFCMHVQYITCFGSLFNPHQFVSHSLLLLLLLLFLYSGVVNEYVKQMRQLACELLDMLGEGLELEDSGVFSRLLKDSDNDSLVRLNHYPTPCLNRTEDDQKLTTDTKSGTKNRIGFGEHSDPQILSILRSNDADGLQILLPSSSSPADDGTMWVPVPADPTAFYVNVGDVLQVLTNGRLISVRHRAMANPSKSRMSIIFFGAPSLTTRISTLREMIRPHRPRRYKSFTWGEYKKAMYSLRLGHNRLDLFLAEPGHKEDTDLSD